MHRYSERKRHSTRKIDAVGACHTRQLSPQYSVLKRTILHVMYFHLKWFAWFCIFSSDLGSLFTFTIKIACLTDLSEVQKFKFSEQDNLMNTFGKIGLKSGPQDSVNNFYRCFEFSAFLPYGQTGRPEIAKSFFDNFRGQVNFSLDGQLLRVKLSH